ncbi:sigma-54-dependent Fis family transcriptional regulator, partial [candidate division KSB1 bacterium]|nr:sigma-54-dependent Fis family transcriptional regulator [candidate division KSB1 bacterium]
NIRELKNIIERAVIMENDPTVINALIHHHHTPCASQTPPATQRLDAMEKEHIRQVLQQTNYNKSAAAQRLGIARKTLREKMTKYQL